MKVPKRHHASQCDGKFPFEMEVHARAVAKKRKGLKVYKCPHCFMWHVGNQRPTMPKFEKRKKRVELILQTEWVEE